MSVKPWVVGGAALAATLSVLWYGNARIPAPLGADSTRGITAMDEFAHQPERECPAVAVTGGLSESVSAKVPDWVYDRIENQQREVLQQIAAYDEDRSDPEKRAALKAAITDPQFRADMLRIARSQMQP